MTAKQLRELIADVEHIDAASPSAIAELRDALANLVEHCYFRQNDLERNQR